MIGFDVRPHQEGVPRAVIDRFRTIDAATIGHVTDCGFLATMRPLFTPLRMIGPAVTVRTPGACGAVIREALIMARPGDVLVIEMEGERSRACWGELRTLAAKIKGLAGVVVAGRVTDSRAVCALDFPIFSEGISALTTRGGSGKGEVNIPLDLGGVAVASGDLVVGDDDGLFVIAKAQASLLADAVEEKARRDEVRREQLHSQWTGIVRSIARDHKDVST